MNPISLKIKNFLSYKDQEIKFDGLDNIILITGLNSESSSQNESNGSGKSSFLDSILYALYGRVRGASNKELVKDDVIHINNNGTCEKYAKVEYVFDLDGVLYRVTRRKNYDGPNELELHSNSGSGWVCLTLSPGVNKRTGKKENGITRTQQRIDTILKANCDLFINSVFHEQKNTNTFASMDDSKKQSLMRQALYLDKWVDYENEIRSQNSEVGKVKRSLEYTIDKSQTMDELVSKRDDLYSSMDVNKNELDKQNELKDTCEKDLRAIELKISKHDDVVELKNELSVKITHLKDSIIVNEREIVSKSDDIYGVENKIKSLYQLIKNKKLDCEKYQEQIDGIDVSELSYDDNDIESILVDIERLSEKMVGVRSEMDILNGVKKSIINDKNKCPMGQNTCDFSDTTKKHKLEKTQNEIDEIEKVVNVIKSDIVERKNKYRYMISEKTKYESLKNTLVGLQRKLQDVLNEIESIDSNIEVYNESLVSKKIELENLNRSHGHKLDELKMVNHRYLNLDDGGYDELVIGKRKIQSDLKSYIDQIEKANRLIVDCKSEWLSTCSKIEDLERVILEHGDICKKSDVLSYLVKIISKDIPHQLIELALPEVESYSQIFLDHLSGGRMNLTFITQRELKKRDKETGDRMVSDKLALDVVVDGISKKYGLCSGGEQSRVDIAIHLGFAAFILNRSGARLQTLFLDEVTSALDHDGKMNLISLFDRLTKEFGFKKIFLISQDSKLNKMFDMVVTVKKTNDGSVLLF